MENNSEEEKKLFDYVIELNKVVKAFAKKETRHKMLKQNSSQ